MNKLKELRAQKGFSQFALGRLANIYPQKISNYETGKRDLRFEEAVNIANALKVSVNELIENTGLASQNGDASE